jgi:hypothetical protein
MIRWRHEVKVGLIGAFAYALLAHISVRASNHAFENPNPTWFEILSPLWFALSVLIPGFYIGWAAKRRPYLIAVGAYLLGGCSFYISRYSNLDAYRQYAPAHSVILELLRETISISVVGAVVAFVSQQMRRRSSNNAIDRARNV